MVNGKTDRVIGDRYETLALDKVMRNRKEGQYVGKDDSMTDMTDITETSDIFSSYYKIQIIMFLVTMNTTYHFETILESNSYFTEYGNNLKLYQFVQCSHHYSL